MMYPHLTNVELADLRSTTNDTTLPSAFRAALSEVLDRREELTKGKQHARTEYDTLRRSIREAETVAADRLIAAAAKLTKQTERAVMADLDKTLQAVEQMGRYWPLFDRSLYRIDELHIPATFREHLVDLVAWVATQRVQLDWWTAPVGTVTTVWRYTARYVAVELPLEAWETSPGVYTREPLRLVLDLRDVRPDLVTRVMFTWSALAAGLYERVDSGRFKITAAWSERPDEPARPAPKQRRRVFGFSHY